MSATPESNDAAAAVVALGGSMTTTEMEVAKDDLEAIERAEDVAIDNVKCVPVATLEWFGHSLRILSLGSAENDTLLLAADVAKVVGFSHTPHMLRMAKPEHRGPVRLVDRSNDGDVRPMSTITVDGLIWISIRSNRENLEDFQRWVVRQVRNILEMRKVQPPTGNAMPANASIAADVARLAQDAAQASTLALELTAQHADVVRRVVALEDRGPEALVRLQVARAEGAELMNEQRRLRNVLLARKVNGLVAAVASPPAPTTEAGTRIRAWMAAQSIAPTTAEAIAGAAPALGMSAMAQVLRALGYVQRKARGRRNTGNHCRRWYPGNIQLLLGSIQ